MRNTPLSTGGFSDLEGPRQPREQSSPSYQVKKRRILWWLVGISLLYGVIHAFLLASDNLDSAVRIFWVALAHLMIVRWCKNDSKQRHHALGVGTHSMLIIPAIGFVVYALQTRGLAGILTILSGLFFVLIISLIVGFTSASIQVFILGSFAGH